MLKKTIIAAAFVAPFLFAASAHADVRGCAAKRQEIQRQLDYARAHSNKHRVIGLEQALREHDASCTDSGLAAKRQGKIAEKERKVYERQADLEKAKLRGDPKKIAKQNEKLREAQKELEQARSELRR